jgi:polyhydroxyalkanoate synthesis regulator phasin
MNLTGLSTLSQETLRIGRIDSTRITDENYIQEQMNLSSERIATLQQRITDLKNQAQQLSTSANNDNN